MILQTALPGKRQNINQNLRLQKAPISHHYWQATGCLFWALQWRHNGCDGVSNHQPHDCIHPALKCGATKSTEQQQMMPERSRLCHLNGALYMNIYVLKISRQREILNFVQIFNTPKTPIPLHYGRAMECFLRVRCRKATKRYRECIVFTKDVQPGFAQPPFYLSMVVWLILGWLSGAPLLVLFDFNPRMDK